MRTVMLGVFFLPLLANAQLDKSIIKLLEDKSCIYIDSSIMYIVDTNNKNRAMQPHGVWRTRNNRRKTLLSIISYSDGRMHGHQIGFYPEGNIAHSVYYKFDVLQGPSVSFWQNGSPQTSMFYENGFAEGVVKSYDTSAHLIKISEVTKGKKEGVELEFFPCGNIRVVTRYSEGKESGLRREYKDDNNSEVLVEYEMKQGVRTIGRFYENGILNKTITF